MATYIQAERPMRVSTPLGKDVLLLVGFTGQEAISQLFGFELDLLAENHKEVPFEKLLGQKISVDLELAAGKRRYFHGICNRVVQAGHDEFFTEYRMTVVPQAWLLTKKGQSRIFQHLSVPDILKKLFEGLDVAYETMGTFHPRDFCVQYRETDLNFASRLMEEEGIYYFFKHSAEGHKMVLANTPQSHPEMPWQSRIVHDELWDGNRDEPCIHSWEKAQELRAGKFTLWDHCFEMPDKHLEATKISPDVVQAGKVTHRLKLGSNDKLELYEYPGKYAKRFDGIHRGGADKPGDLQKIFDDASRLAELRMQQEALGSIVIRGTSWCGQLATGHKFTRMQLKAGSPVPDGEYIVTSIAHSAHQRGQYRSGGGGDFQYYNHFTCIPVDLPFRPPRTTPKPVVQGSQTAVVVGPPDEEIFTDKYGRVKVQFHWDRDGHKNADSSCWARVATFWAGKQWGAIHIPRIGQEVIVDFEDGDPDQPVIVGSVYNAEMMPPYKLPDHKTQSGIKTRSSMSGGPDNFNELRFEDKKGSEEVYFHAEKDFTRVVENNDVLKVGSSTATDGSQTTEIHKDRTTTLKTGNEKLTLGKGNREVKIEMGSDKLTIKMGDQTTKLDLGKSKTEALQSIELKVGQSSIKLDQTGISITGLTVKVEGQIQTQVKGLITQVSADAMLQARGSITMIG